MSARRPIPPADARRYGSATVNLGVRVSGRLKTRLDLQVPHGQRGRFVEMAIAAFLSLDNPLEAVGGRHLTDDEYARWMKGEL